eukprot:TRINITY_DN14242_c0_g1_i1.p1 TRINITY_DN14242_c0_g1~~TRINITY_DN14242_c0_g1_i1.p1  ORF type:complete len:151 (+),score=32.20 TRINITY_DN14242_c0_g1_i1:68-520(+)
MAISSYKILLCLAFLGLPCFIADDAACSDDALEDTTSLLQQQAKVAKEVDSHKTHGVVKQQEDLQQNTKVDEQVLEVSENSGTEYSLTIYWILGGPKQSCDQVCKTRMVQGKVLSCDRTGFDHTHSVADVMKAAQGSGTQCKAYWANTGA